MIKKIAFVAHPAKDMQQARRFWGELLGLPETSEYQGKWVEFDTPDGKSIALDGYSAELSPDPKVYLALETDDIEAELTRLREGGVPVIKDVWDNKVCKMALIADPDGNVLMLHQIAPERA